MVLALAQAMVGGKRREMGLGGFPDVTLAGAKEAARAARALIDQGIDPVAERQAKRSALAAAVASTMTFNEASMRYIAAHEAGWKKRQARRPMAQYAGNLRIPGHRQDRRLRH